MRYRLVYTERADRDIQELNPKIKERLGKALLRYEADPLRHAERLTHSTLGSYREWGQAFIICLTGKCKFSKPNPTRLTPKQRTNDYQRVSRMRRAAGPMSPRCSTTWTPASRRAAIFPSAVPMPREMMAPAWP